MATTKRPRKRASEKRVRRLPHEWVQAISDIVASITAKARVAGHDVDAEATGLAQSLIECVPRAQKVLDLCGHSHNVASCRCYAYALLQVDAVDSGRKHGLPPQAILNFSVRTFDHWMNGRS